MVFLRSEVREDKFTVKLFISNIEQEKSESVAVNSDHYPNLKVRFQDFQDGMDTAPPLTGIEVP